ncbi:hypothetical protein [Halorientalis salina]|uniref:hypothetical protein n=1 Tax=Halorientalis salina TaxID=2932266 RepID=UPI0010AB948F|nr:hypothetical protein [Halorientalis salina]
MHEQFRGPALQSPERPDTFFAFVAGLYAALLLTPAVVIGLGLWVSGDAAVLYFGLLAAVTAITVGVAWGVTRWRGLPERMGATRVAWGLVFLPVFALLGYFAFLAAVESSSASAGALVGFLFCVVGILVGIGLVAMSRSRYADAVVDDESVTCEWTAGWPDQSRKRLQYASVVAMCLLVPIWAGGYLLNAEWVGTVAQVLFVPVILLGNVGRERTYRVTPAGLERRDPATRYLYEWDAFESYAVTDETIVVRWRSRWRPAIRCARADIDVDAVTAALGDHLPRA